MSEDAALLSLRRHYQKIVDEKFDGVVPREGMTGGAEDDSASAPAGESEARDSAR